MVDSAHVQTIGSSRWSCLAVLLLHTSGVLAANHATYDLGTKYECGPDAGDGTTHIFWPDGDGPFHVVFFAHGSSGYDDDMTGWMETVADTGFVVVAPGTGACDDCSSNDACLTDADLTLAFSQSQSKKGDLHTALRDGFADWSRTGVFGHSMGAKHLCTMYNNAPSDFNIKALVMSHDADMDECSSLTKPSMYTVSAEDTDDRQALAKDAFDAAGSQHKVFANLANGGHMEPEITGANALEGQLNQMTAYFLSAHISQNTHHYNLIYGSGSKSLCSGDIAYKEPTTSNCVTAEPANVVSLV